MPESHIDFAISNGMNALALTEHGNMNSLSYSILHTKKLKEKGIDFKPIMGVEAYFIPSVEEWKKEKDRVAVEKKENKKLTKKEIKEGKIQEEVETIDEDNSLTIEDETASKTSTKSKLNKRAHLILLAQNQKGLNNIFKMVSMSYTGDNYYRFPRIDYEMLKKYNEGVIAFSACLGGIYARDYWDNYENGKEAILNAMRETTRKMLDIFGDRWYGELQWNSIGDQHALNQLIIQISKEFNIRLVSTADSHYPRPELFKDRELYKKIGWLNKKSDKEENKLPESIDDLKYELYPKNGDQMWEAYKKYSKQTNNEYDDQLVLDSIEETHDIAFNRIENFLPETSIKLPNFVIPEGMTADEALEKFALEGLKNKKLDKKTVYVDRLSKELDTIKTNKFSQYFLTMKAITDKANEMMIVGPGRGSGAGSLLAYVLNITQIDPIRWDLQFERFMRKGQTDMPDIDTDFAETDTMKEALVKEWGSSRVVPITNWNTLQLKSLIKDIAKFYDVPFNEVNSVTNKMLLEATPAAKAKHGIKAGVYVPTFEEVMEFSKSLQDFLKKYSFIEKHVKNLHGMIRSGSRHAGGILVSENIDSCMPLINNGGTIQTPWAEGQTVRHLEPFGFIKFDILGLETLRMFEGAITHILKRHHKIKKPTFQQIKDFYNKNLHPDVIDFDDQKVYENVFRTGKWPGIFQFANEGAQQFCIKAKPKNLIDISAITSIYRPGTLSANVDKEYVEAKEHPQNIKYIHKNARDILADTYGFMIFQEQLASLAHRLGKDISLEEGNQLRKVLTKKGTGKEDKVKTALYQKFIDGCVEKGISKQLAEDMWQKFIYFSGYSFNKSHAVSYSAISFQCAWLYTYYPSEWMAAFLDKTPEKLKEKAINIAKSFGFEIKSLDINSSGNVWEISEDGKTLIQPLTSIKGLGEAAYKEIENYRPFKTIEDFLFNEKMSYSKLNKKSLDVLVRSGALSSLMDDRFSGMKHFWSVVAVDRARKLPKFLENIETYRPEGDFTEEEKIVFLTDLTGMFPLNRVMSLKLMNSLDDRGIKPIAEYDPELMFVWFIPRKIVKKKTATGKDYWVVEVIDSTNTLTNIKCWGIKESDQIQRNRPYMAKLDYDENWGFSTRSLMKNFRLLG